MKFQNGRTFFIAQEHVGKPFIYPGNLSDSDLCEWLYKLMGTIKRKNSPMEAIEEFKEQIKMLEKTDIEIKRIISESVYPITQDPIRNPESPDTCHKTQPD